MTKEELKSVIANYKELLNMLKEQEAGMKGDIQFENFRKS